MIGTLTGDEIEEILAESSLGRIGCTDGDTCYIVPVSYVYDGKYIIAHSVEGKKLQFMRKKPSVCFEVEDVQSHTNWRTVIIQGKFEEITDEIERYKGMKLFVDRMMKLKISATAQPPEISENWVRPPKPGGLRPVIYRIRVDSKTGRFEKQYSH